jgi:GNAT superfamily N-acetyltransferase
MDPLVLSIREALDADHLVLRELDSAARTEGRRHRGADHLYESLGEFDQRWSQRTAVFRFDVASVRDEIVGFSVVRLGARPLLDQVFVVQQARNLGVGAALLRKAVERHGASNLDALSLPGDRYTKNLYERAGLKARLIIASAL